MPDKAVKGAEAVCVPAANPDREGFEVWQAIRAASNMDLLTQIYLYIHIVRYIFSQIKALFCLHSTFELRMLIMINLRAS